MKLILQHFPHYQYSQKYQEKWCKITNQLSQKDDNYKYYFKKTHLYYSYNVYGCSMNDVITYCKYYLINATSYFKDFSKRAISSFRLVISRLKDFLKLPISSSRMDNDKFVHNRIMRSLPGFIDGIIYYLRGKKLYKNDKKRMYSTRKRNRMPQTIYGWITLSFSIARSLSRPFSRSLYKLDSKVFIFSSKYLYSIVYPKYLFNKIVTNIGITIPLAIRQSFTHCISALAQIFNASSERIIWAPIDFSSLASSLSSSLIKSSLVDFARLFKSSLNDFDSSFKSSLKDFASAFKSPFVTIVSSKTAFFSTDIIYSPLRLFSYIRPIISQIYHRSIPKFTIMTHTKLMDMQGAH